MKAKDGVIEYLNRILTGELTSINQYFLGAHLFEHWGYERLYEKLRAESVEEMKHAEELIEHILFLEGLPNLQRLGNVGVGETVPEQLQLDLNLEQSAVSLLAEAIAHCNTVGDYATRTKLEAMLRSEEEHIDWIETQFETIKQVGLENYLAQQIRD